MEDRIRLSYFYGKEADQFSFYKIPKLLFTDSKKKISKALNHNMADYHAIMERFQAVSYTHLDVYKRQSYQFRLIAKTLAAI